MIVNNSVNTMWVLGSVHKVVHWRAHLRLLWSCIARAERESSPCLDRLPTKTHNGTHSQWHRLQYLNERDFVRFVCGSSAFCVYCMFTTDSEPIRHKNNFINPLKREEQLKLNRSSPCLKLRHHAMNIVSDTRRIYVYASNKLTMTTVLLSYLSSVWSLGDHCNYWQWIKSYYYYGVYRLTITHTHSHTTPIVHSLLFDKALHMVSCQDTC